VQTACENEDRIKVINAELKRIATAAVVKNAKISETWAKETA